MPAISLLRFASRVRVAIQSLLLQLLPVSVFRRVSQWAQFVTAAGSDTALTRHVVHMLLGRLNDEAADHALCVICWAEPKTMVMTPCGRKCVCERCAEGLQQGASMRCPMCRQAVQAIFRVFE